MVLYWASFLAISLAFAWALPGLLRTNLSKKGQFVAWLSILALLNVPRAFSYLGLADALWMPSLLLLVGAAIVLSRNLGRTRQR